MSCEWKRTIRSEPERQRGSARDASLALGLGRYHREVTHGHGNRLHGNGTERNDTGASARRATASRRLALHGGVGVQRHPVVGMLSAAVARRIPWLDRAGPAVSTRSFPGPAALDLWLCVRGRSVLF